MKIATKEIEWLGLYFPNLQYEADTEEIVGQLEFCAAYDDESRKLKIDDGSRDFKGFICDVFDIVICLSIPDANGWPKVYEVGGRHSKIAKKCNVDITDLHFNSNDGTCCLGLKFPSHKSLSIGRFLVELVIPFFYRLSYTEKFGIAASRNDLWGEYSHGAEGELEHRTEISKFAKLNPGRNDLCPCGRGKKYKKCHLDEVEFFKRKHGQ